MKSGDIHDLKEKKQIELVCRIHGRSSIWGPIKRDKRAEIATCYQAPRPERHASSACHLIPCCGGCTSSVSLSSPPCFLYPSGLSHPCLSPSLPSLPLCLLHRSSKMLVEAETVQSSGDGEPPAAQWPNPTKSRYSKHITVCLSTLTIISDKKIDADSPS